MTDPIRAALSADGPAVPERREPASVVREPSDAELLGLMHQSMRDDLAEVSRLAALKAGADLGVFLVTLNHDVARFARAVLARYGHQPTQQVEGEVADEARYLARELRDQADDMSPALELFGLMHRAAELLAQRHPAPVPVAERRISCWPRLPELRGMFERILCVARSSGQRPVGHIELADRLISAVVSWAALPLPATTRDIESND